MKKQLFGLSILTTLLSTSAYAAGPIANIQVTGDIKAPTCTVNGMEQNDVIFDYGRIALGLIPDSSQYKLSATNLAKNIVIQCDAQTYLSFTASTPYPYSGDTSFALVDADDTSKRVGSYSFFVRDTNVYVDGKRATLSSTGKSTSATTTITMNGNVMGWTGAKSVSQPTDSWDWLSGQEFSMLVNPSAGNLIINSKQALEAAGVNITDGFDFIGEQILTFNFGV